MTTRRGLVRAGALALGVIAASLGACHSESGPRWSLDLFTYVSSEWQPKTIEVVDTRTGEVFWSVDIPVGQQLVVGFSQGTGPNEFRPDEIVWEVMPAGRKFGERNNRAPCPPSGSRMIRQTLRPAPEPPGGASGMATWDDEPRPIRRTGGRVVEPVDPPDPGDPGDRSESD